MLKFQNYLSSKCYVYALFERARIGKWMRFPLRVHQGRMRCKDMCTYLADDLPTTMERSSMAVSLEVRQPRLDHRVAEFALSLPDYLPNRDRRRKRCCVLSWIISSRFDCLSNRRWAPRSGGEWAAMGRTSGRNRETNLWDVLMLQAWREHYGV